jgi:hypothetical protein
VNVANSYSACYLRSAKFGERSTLLRRGGEARPGRLSRFRGVQLEESSDWMRSVLSSPRIFIIVLTVEVCILYLLRWPLLYNFNSFAFSDSGAYLVAHYLFQRGYQPLTGFGWQYGLLPLFIQELVFRLFGASPATLLCLTIPCALIVAVVMGRIALLEGGTAGRILVILSLPLMLAFQPDLPHSLEPALLSLGLLSQAKGHHGRALAFAAAACFTKPSMGYLYGLVLLLFVLFHSTELTAPPRFRDQMPSLVPAVCTAFGLSLLLSMTFGWKSVSTSLLPMSGARAYRALHLGWSGVAKELLYFPGVKLGYYIGTPVVFWVIATAYLTAAAGVTWTIAKSVTDRTTNREMILTCATLHWGFIALFYGFPASWTYYTYVLVAGIIATEAWPVAGAVIGALCIFAALANYSVIRSALSAWQTMETDSATAGLFTVPGERAEWHYVVSLTKRDQPALFTNCGAAPLLFPWLSAPAGAFIVAGVATGSELLREKQMLRTASAVIVPAIPGLGNSLKVWPGAKFSDVLEDKTRVFKGTYFEVYKRQIAH